MDNRFFILAQVIMATVILLTIALTAAGIFPFDNVLGIYRELPGNIVLDFVWVYAISLLIGLLVYMVGGKMSWLFIRIHGRLTGRGYLYRFSAEPPLQGSEIRRLLVPAFVSLGLSIYLGNVTEIANTVFVVESFDSLEPYSAMIMTEAMSMFFIMLLVSCFVGILFGPIWILENSGVIHERIVDGQVTETGETGRWYSSRLAGFASISAILAYVIIASKTILWFQVLPGMIDYPLVFYTIPLIVTVFAPLFALGPISLSYFLFEKSVTRHEESTRKQLGRD
ncbi:MAG: hypothetical protein EAX95_07535 [Candidatus Thorarchaeota archaeon]|nr:hypothetical protein [Candidatus Thorarchaeota archaeon]